MNLCSLLPDITSNLLQTGENYKGGKGGREEEGKEAGGRKRGKETVSGKTDLRFLPQMRRSDILKPR